MSETAEALRARMRTIGRRGGIATMKKYGKQHLVDIAPMGGRATKGLKHKAKRRYVPFAQAAAAVPLLRTLDEILASLEAPA